MDCVKRCCECERVARKSCCECERNEECVKVEKTIVTKADIIVKGTADKHTLL